MAVAIFVHHRTSARHFIEKKKIKVVWNII